MVYLKKKLSTKKTRQGTDKTKPAKLATDKVRQGVSLQRGLVFALSELPSPFQGKPCPRQGFRQDPRQDPRQDTDKTPNKTPVRLAGKAADRTNTDQTDLQQGSPTRPPTRHRQDAPTRQGQTTPTRPPTRQTDKTPTRRGTDKVVLSETRFFFLDKT